MGNTKVINCLYGPHLVAATMLFDKRLTNKRGFVHELFLNPILFLLRRMNEE